ncbi:MAG: sulfate ABC transporter permease [Tepidisphaeraceae bacterium]
MSLPAPAVRAPANSLPPQLQQRGGRVTRWLLIGLTYLFLGAFIGWPTVNIFRQAFSKGVDAYVKVFDAPAAPVDAKLPRRERREIERAHADAEKTRDAIGMTVIVAAVAVPLNTLFGIAAAWAITKFRFKGKTLLVSLIDLPFSVSPVVAGLIFVLLMGRNGYFGDAASSFQWPWPFSAYWQGFGGHWFPIGFSEWKQGVIFTPLATVLASTFVTFPFVARALIPLMESQGAEQEQAALTLGAGGWRTFFRITLPQIKWGLLYGIILCTARALGEFGAVSVVSGHLDSNDTIPLRIEKVWQSYDNQAAFAIASLLACFSIVTLLLKVIIDRKIGQDAEEATP